MGSLCVNKLSPEYEANYSPSSSAEDENAWNFTSTTSYIFMT